MAWPKNLREGILTATVDQTYLLPPVVHLTLCKLLIIQFHLPLFESLLLVIHPHHAYYVTLPDQHQHQ